MGISKQKLNLKYVKSDFLAYGAAQLVFYFPNCYIFEKRILGGILMGDNSHMSVRHTIREKGFTYNMIKGKLEKNSIISKGIHPVPQVEGFASFLPVLLCGFLCGYLHRALERHRKYP